ncbi:MAG: tRNA pseudouridine(55) synthase TruB [Patescibacteria group bacterium]
MILNIYKEKHWTSFDVVAKIRSILKTKKVGHAGTLDPLAEGVLLVLTDKDTKRQNELMHQEKEYIAEIVFGIKSPTYDMEGPLEELNTNIDATKLQTKLAVIIPEFVGEIYQKVPAFSAVKVKGKKLYKQARKGTLDKDDLPVKKVFIKSIDLISVEANCYKSFPIAKIKVTCGSGTYIRSLAYDMGKRLGHEATLYSLIRTRVGFYTVNDSKKIEELILP